MPTKTNKALYLHNIVDIPLEHQDLFIALNQQIELAFAKRAKGINQITRSAINGDYFFVNEDLELVEINLHTNQDTGEKYYIANEANNRWYSDPYYTLRDAKKGLGL